MKRGKWPLILVSLGLFLVGSFFFFLGGISRLFSEKTRSGNVAIVEVLGRIVEARTVVEELRELRKDNKVKAVVLRIDSPGGSVGASQEIFESVQSLKAVKPVVASMGTVAASGGYYIASPASKIVANAGTVTGSIGVRMELLNVEDLLQWARLKPMTLKSGRLKDVGSPTRPMTPEEREFLEGILKELHLQFKKAVAENRGLSLEEVDRLADGRVFTGAEAREKKLVDEIGSLEKAIKIAGQLGGIRGEPEPFYPPSGEKKFWECLVEGAAGKVAGEFFEALRSQGGLVRFSY